MKRKSTVYPVKEMDIFKGIVRGGHLLSMLLY